MARRVIQGLTCTEPKQPQEAAPVTALQSAMIEENEWHISVANHASFFNSPSQLNIPTGTIVKPF